MSLLFAVLLANPVLTPEVTTDALPFGQPFEAAESPALPYREWSPGEVRGPVAPLADRAPAPGPPEPEHARRLFEVVPDVGVALPDCGSGRADCGDLPPGAEVGITLLYRPVPHFAFGAAARLDAFSLTSGAGAERSSARSSFFGVVGRVYAFDNGLLDPYLELGIGGGSLGASRSGRGRRTDESVAFAPALRVGAGLDVVVNSWLRLGPAFAFSRYAPSTVQRCVDHVCSSLAFDPSSVPRGTTSFGFRLTLSTGERL